MRRSVSIIIPAYNEEKRLPGTLQIVESYLSSSPWEFSEIVVVNDGSRDGTAAAARQAGARVLENPGNRGKGYSVRHGMLEARGDWLLLSDADLSAPIDELDKLWQAVERQGAQAAIGSRALDRSLIGVRQPLFREGMGRFFNLAMRMVTGLPFRDTQCGFKLFEANAAREIFRAPAARRIRVRRRGSLYRAASRISRARSAGALERCRGNHGEPLARIAGLRRPRQGALERDHRKVRRRPQTLTMTSRSRSRVRKNFTDSNSPNSFSRLRLLKSWVGLRMPCCDTCSRLIS